MDPEAASAEPVAADEVVTAMPDLDAIAADLAEVEEALAALDDGSYWPDEDAPSPPETTEPGSS